MKTNLTRINGTKNKAAYAVLSGTSEIGTVEATGGIYTAYAFGGRMVGEYRTGEEAAAAVAAEWSK